MCTQQKYRETYFCCLGKCDASVLPGKLCSSSLTLRSVPGIDRTSRSSHTCPDSIARQTTQCVAFNIPFTFDAEAVCGIKLVTTSSAITSGATTSTATSASQSSAVSASITVTTTSAASQTSSGGPTPTATTNSAPSKMKLSNGVAVLIAMAGMLT